MKFGGANQALQQLVKEWKEEAPFQRLGQFFINNYYKGEWPEMFYASNEAALVKLNKYLYSIGYTMVLPQRVNKDDA